MLFTVTALVVNCSFAEHVGITVLMHFFLHHFFQDKGMSYFFEHGRFPADRMEYPRKSKNLIVVLFWNAILGLPLVWYFIPVILSGSTASLLTAAALALVGKLHQVYIKGTLS